jgi:glycosyltransferase involved in cell wall biosynthesis
MDGSISSQKQTGEEERHRIISVGSLKRVKGHDVLIEAFRDVVDTYPSATLQIVGDGPLRSEYEALIDQKGLAERVELMGWCSPEEVRKRLRKASLFVFPSRHEGFGLALVEAMAVGLPVVASDTGGIPEVVGPEYEFLASTNAPDQYSRKISRLLNNDALLQAVGNQCHERAKKFGWSNTIKRYESTLSAEEL